MLQQSENSFRLKSVRAVAAGLSSSLIPLSIISQSKAFIICEAKKEKKKTLLNCCRQILCLPVVMIARCSLLALLIVAVAHAFSPRLTRTSAIKVHRRWCNFCDRSEHRFILFHCNASCLRSPFFADHDGRW